MNSIMGRNVTLETLLDKPVYLFIVWNFNDGTEKNIATQTQSGLKVKEAYEGRVSIDSVTGSLTLMGLKPEDDGDYSITIIAADGTTRTAEIALRVLGELSGSSSSSDRVSRHSAEWSFAHRVVWLTVLTVKRFFVSCFTLVFCICGVFVLRSGSL